MPNTRPSSNRRKATADRIASASSGLTPVAVSSSSLESAAAAAAAAPSGALTLDYFDLDDFTNDAFGAVIPNSSISPDLPPSHPGAAIAAGQATADADADAAADADADKESSDTPQTNTVPEFLYQLTKLLTDDNRDAIEWSHGNIEVHNPHKLESDVLSKYFRHSKYASFQRQLNYFGFTKRQGKGKMAPCSYTNDHTTPDIRCLLSIKRKASTPRDRSGTKRDKSSEPKPPSIRVTASSDHPANPVLAGISQKSGGFKRARLQPDSAPTGKGVTFQPGFKLASSGGVKHQLNGFLKRPSGKSNQVTLAQAAVGKGVRHSYSAPQSSATETGRETTVVKSPGMTFLDPPQLGMSVESSLSELTSNYLKAQGDGNSAASANSPIEDTTSHFPNVASSSMLSRESSLVDLAMLPTLPLPTTTQTEEMNSSPFTFEDFPNQASYELPPSDDKL